MSSTSELYYEADLTKVQTTSVLHRTSRVQASEVRLVAPRCAAAETAVEALPDFLGAADLRRTVQWWEKAVLADRGVLLMCGGHVIKVGLGPMIVELMREGAIGHLVLNGAAAIHDLELACFGHTSEDVGQGLQTGQFGTWEETGQWFAQAARESRRGRGLGEALCQLVAQQTDDARRHVSVLAMAHMLGVPVTVHAAIGTDIVHQHPLMDGADLGEATARDFRRLAGYLPRLDQGGLVLNWGSAVVLPEVFVKALNVSRNLTSRPFDIRAVNCDMQRHYRPEQNVLRRPTEGGQAAINLIGQHEILLPLLGWTVIERLRRRDL